MLSFAPGNIGYLQFFVYLGKSSYACAERMSSPVAYLDCRPSLRQVATSAEVECLAFFTTALIARLEPYEALQRCCRSEDSFESVKSPSGKHVGK